MRRIKKATIEFISLVPKGANKLQAIYKDDGSFTVSALSKLAEDGELTAVVYAPNMRDAQGDIADADVVKQMSYDFIASGAKIDIRHNNKPLTPEMARVAESFLVQKSDPRFSDWKDTDGKPVDLTGAWATVIKIDDPDLREKFRSGEWAGVSMGGTAVVEQEKSADVDRLIDALNKAINPPAQPEPNKDDEMTPEQLAELQKSFTDGFTALGATIEKALKPAAQTEPKKIDKEEPKEKVAPKFKGSLLNETDVRKHAIEMQMFTLEKELNWDDQESIDDFLEGSEDLRKELAELTKSAAEEKASRRVGAADRSGRNKKAPAGAIAGISKEQSDEVGIGIALADAINKELYGEGDED
jgi:hypothetical protein